ncbi:MAG: mreD [Chlamydiota bacterium]
MNLRTKNLKLIFLTTCLFTLFLPNLFPFVHLLYFVPFLVITIYQKPLTTCLWFSLICGLLLDLLSDGTRLGFYAMNYAVTSFALYPQRKNFFSDSITTLPIMSFFFSIISTIIELTYRSSTGKLPSLSIQWAFTDLLVMPAADAMYSFAVFILPFALFGKPQRKGTDYFTTND